MSRNPCDALAVYCYDHRLRQRHLDLLDALGVSADPFSQPGGARRVLALGRHRPQRHYRPGGD